MAETSSRKKEITVSNGIQSKEGGTTMKRSGLLMGVVIGVVMALTFSMPLWAAEGKKPTDINTEKIEMQKDTKSPAPETTIKLPGPKINAFSCESLSGGYNILLFNGSEALSVTCRISAKQGLRKFEILFNGDRIYEESFPLMGPMVKNKSYRDLRIDPSPARPGRSGRYTLQARVEDRLGAVATRDIRLRVDMENPTITSINPPCGSDILVLTTPTSITFEIDATDDFSGVQKVVLQVGLGDRYEDTTAPYRITVPIDRIPPHCLFRYDEFRVIDNEGNARSIMYHECEYCIKLRTMGAE
jgi:hypothetical protein